jgi:hypothetical protein
MRTARSHSSCGYLPCLVMVQPLTRQNLQKSQVGSPPARQRLAGHRPRRPRPAHRQAPQPHRHGPAKREAQALRARLLTQVDEGRRPATDATLAQLLERWLEMADLAWSTRLPTRATSSGSSCRRSAICHCGVSTPPPSPASTQSCAAAAASAADRWRRPPCAKFTRSCAGHWIRRPTGAGFRPTQLPWPAHPDLGRPRSARPPPRRSPGSLRPPTRLIPISRSCCGWPRRRVLSGESYARCGGRMLTWRRPSS